ncbi:MAG: Ig-like domain-containing protein [bacterium]
MNRTCKVRNSTWMGVLTLFILMFSQQLFAQTKIMPLGDSIVRGDKSTDDAGFRNDLADSLNNESINFVFVGSVTTNAGGDHEGHGGFRADQILANITTYLNSENPDVVLLHIGTNDISQGQTPASTITEIEGIVDAIKNHSASTKIILASLVPRNDGDGGAKDDLTTSLNNLIIGLYLDKRDLGYNIFYAGMNEVFKCNSSWKNDYLFDAVHPNDTGYAVMAGVWFNLITNALNNGDLTVTDSFNRQFLSSVWESDPDNVVTSNTLINNSTVDSWDNISIYKGIINASKVSMKWHTSSDVDGIEFSGLALRLDKCDEATADGYAVTVRVSQKKIRLWKIQQGTIVTPFVDEYQYSQGGLPDPQPGQVLSVAMTSDGSGNSFEVSINGTVYQTLVDGNPPASSGRLYSGVILFGNRNNNIAEFSAEGGGDFEPPSQIQDLTVTSVTATSVALSWTAPGGDGTQGTASSYDLRYATTPISSENDFNAATQATGLPNPSASGTTENFIVADLLPGTTYHFAIRSQDGAGNNSLISSPNPSATTDDGILVSDDFNRPSLGANWAADNSFQIVNNELSNTAGNAGVWNLAVYTAKSNPTSVSFKWGASADANGIDQGGIAVMMDAADTTANGYLITRRTVVPEFRLWTVTNGVQLSKIKTATPQFGPPQAGQEFRVEISTDGGVNSFKVFVNGNEDVTLTDETLFIDPSVVTIQYAGVMLGDGENNNVDDFKMLLSPNSLQKVAVTDTQTGTVGQALPQAITAKLLDGSQLPVPGENITFEVTAGGGSLSDPSGSIVKEAENASFTAPMTTGTDGAASDGTFIWVPEGEGTGGQVGRATLNFTITQAGNYYMWGRAIYPDGGSDAFKIIIDNGPEYNWDVDRRNTSTVWKWNAVSHRGSGTRANPEIPKVQFFLDAGAHTLVIRESKDGTKLDQILFTTDDAFVPSGILSVGGQQLTIVTDANGEASANWTLGTVAGTDNNMVTASFAGLSVDFTASAQADVPVTITKFNENQSAPPGSVLPLDLIVELKDQYDNLVTNHETNWSVINNSDGQLGIPNPILTGVDGMAHNTLTTASNAPVTEVQVTSPGYTGADVVFAIQATGGDPDSLFKYTQDSGDNQLGTASKPLTKPFKVKVADKVGLPVSNVDVTFMRILGNGNFSGNAQITVPTDAQGIAAATLTLGPNPDAVNTAQATASFQGSPLSGAPVSFTANSAAPLKIEAISQLNHNGTVNQPIPGDSIKVRVLDTLNQPLPGFSVNFLVTKGDGKANGVANRNVPTNGSGIAAVEWRLGPVAGQLNNELQASASFDNQSLANSPLTFTASAAEGAAANLVEVSGDSLSGSIENTLNAPFVVKVTDASDNPISGWIVKFKVIAGGGNFNGADSLEIPTNAQGLASATLTLGSTAGTPTNPYNNVVEVSSLNNGHLNGSPMTFVASAVATQARILEFLAGDGQTGPAGLALPQQIKFRVTDSKKNPIQGHNVTFKIMNTSGTINGTASSDTFKVIPTNANGEASVAWYLGGHLGVNSQSLKVSATDGINQLIDSPRTIFASATVGPVDPNVSQIVSDKTQLPADGQSVATITVTLQDKFQNPVSGKAVTILSSGSDNFIEQPLDPTDANGQVTGTIASRKAEVKNVNARDISDGITLNSSVNVQFSAIQADRIEPGGGNNQTANVGTALDNPIEVIVKDENNNPVPGVDVEFVVPANGGGGYIMNGGDAAPKGATGQLAMVTSTDSQGRARAFWILGATPGINRAEARVEGLIGSPVDFTATGEAATPANLTIYGGANQPGGTAGRVLPEPLAILISDANQKPVWNVPVTFEAQLGGGSFDGQTSITVTTDYQGVASVQFTLGPIVGTNIVQVSSSALPGQTQPFSFESQVGLASRLDIFSGDGGSGVVNTLYAISVRITDVHGNPVQGAHAGFQVLEGGATIEGPANTQTDDAGLAATQLRLPTEMGEILVKATSDNLPNFFKNFHITALAGAAAVIDTVSGQSGNKQLGTVGRELVYPFQVKITDVYGNPVSGAAVQWLATQGGGDFAQLSTFSDATGYAENTLILGAQAGFNEAWAINSKLTGNPVIFTATGVTNNYPVFETIGNKTVMEGNSLQFTVKANDDDGDHINYDIEAKPAGASFNAGSATFQWTPTLQQAGEYQVTFIARDGKGGMDAETIAITVTNSNLPPVITEYKPAVPDTFYVVGASILFSVTVEDTDPLQYEWRLFTGGSTNGTLVSTSPQFLFDSNEFSPASYLVKVEVTDGQDRATHSWNIDIITSVELSSFAAQFAGFEGAKISWTTSREIDNLGFNILRSRSKNGRFEVLNKEIIKSRAKGDYHFFDKNVQVGVRYYYILEDLDIDGNKTKHGPIALDVSAPETFELSQNFPNPFNPETKIRFQLPAASRVQIKIFDVLGREVTTLIDELKDAGYHVITWNAKNKAGHRVSSGIYYYQIMAGEFHQTKKMLLIK